MKRLILTALVPLMTIALAACGGPAKPAKGPGAAPPPPPSGPTTKVDKPMARKISKAAKMGFADAIKAYNKAKKKGITKSNCADLAGNFASVFASHPKLPEAGFNEGVVWEECGQLTNAERAYQGVLRKHPKHGASLNNVGQIYFNKGQVGVAVQYFTKAAAAKSSEGYANLAVIQRNKALNDPQALADAVANVHRALAMDSFNIEAYGTLALVLYDHAKNRSQLEMARLICAQGMKVDAKYPPMYNIMGLIYLRMGKVTQALANFRQAASLNKNYLEALMNIGAITLSFRDYKSAEGAFQHVIGLNPKRKTKVQALVGLGVAFRGQRRFKEALDTYNKARKLDASNVGISYNIGILIQDYTFDASDPIKAIKQLQEAATYLEKYKASGKNSGKQKDVMRRLKNIRDMVPMLREQHKMMEQMKKMQQQAPPPKPAPKAAPAPPAKKAPAAAPAKKAPAAAPAKKAPAAKAPAKGGAKKGK